MNNDLISRSEAIAAVERREPLLVGDKLVSTDSFKNFLRNRPAVDAEPVRHGRWVKSTREDEDWGGFFYRYTCTVCGWHTASNPDGLYIYCPHCGTKMDGGADGETD